MTVSTAPPGNWQWRNPQPTGAVLNAIACPGLNTCYAVGLNGTIINTSDGGTNWKLQTSGTEADLYGISCPATDICFAVGASGTILRTADSGQSWQPQLQAQNIRFNAVSCASINTCVAVGYGGQIFGLDNSQPWTSQSSGVTTDLSGISCRPTKECVAVGYGKTLSNGGTNSWTQQAPGNFYGVSCTTASNCVAVSGPVVDGLIDVNAGPGLYTTGTGGASWQPVTTEASLYGVSCYATGNCTAVGFFRNVGNSYIGAAIMALKGGQWVYQFPPEKTPRLNAASCPGPTTCFAVGGDSANQRNSSAILTTTDGGQTWNSQLGGALETLNGVACADTTNCFAVGENGTILGSNDSSASWQRLSSVTALNLNAITCPDALDCFAVGENGAIITTTDGGKTWLAQGNGSGVFWGISCPSASNCYASGEGGIWNITRQAGGSLNIGKVYNQNGILYGISCPIPNLCYAVGEGGKLVTFDGAAWSSVTSGTAANLYGVTCPDTDDCYVVGAQGTILSRTAGSTTWKVRTSGTTSGLSGVSCTSASVCYTSGENGDILTTNDSGFSWTKQSAPDRGILYSITCREGCITVGYAGAILSNIRIITDPLLVTQSTDDGTGTVFGTLSYALNVVQDGQTIKFNLSGNKITLSNPPLGFFSPLNLKAGANISASCASPVTIDAGHLAQARLVLNGRSTVQGLRFINASPRTLKATGKNNILICTKVAER